MIDEIVNEIGFVYGIQSLHLIKIGVAQDIEKRLKTMRLHNPHGCELVFYRRVFAPYAFEKRMHELLADKAIGREWFNATVMDVRQAALKARCASEVKRRKIYRARSIRLARPEHSQNKDEVISIAYGS